MVVSLIVCRSHGTYDMEPLQRKQRIGATNGMSKNPTSWFTVSAAAVAQGRRFNRCTAQNFFACWDRMSEYYLEMRSIIVPDLSSAELDEHCGYVRTYMYVHQAWGTST